MADYNMNAMTDEEREAAIEKLESERLSVVLALESVMKEFARETGRRSLGKRRFKVGKAPNDWRGKKKI